MPFSLAVQPRFTVLICTSFSSANVCGYEIVNCPVKVHSYNEPNSKWVRNFDSFILNELSFEKQGSGHELAITEASAPCHPFRPRKYCPRRLWRPAGTRNQDDHHRYSQLCSRSGTGHCWLQVWNDRPGLC